MATLTINCRPRCAILAVTLSIAAAACVASTTAVIGAYEAVDGHRGSMTISKKDARLRIELQGGSVVNSGASAAGDCEAVAEGELAGNVLHAKLVPFEGDVTSLDASDIARMNSTVTVSFEKGVADVQGTFAHCGLQNSLNGKYKKSRRSAIPS